MLYLITFLGWFSWNDLLAIFTGRRDHCLKVLNCLDKYSNPFAFYFGLKYRVKDTKEETFKREVKAIWGNYYRKLRGLRQYFNDFLKGKIIGAAFLKNVKRIKAHMYDMAYKRVFKLYSIDDPFYTDKVDHVNAVEIMPLIIALKDVSGLTEFYEHIKEWEVKYNRWLEQGLMQNNAFLRSFNPDDKKRLRLLYSEVEKQLKENSANKDGEPEASDNNNVTNATNNIEGAAGNVEALEQALAGLEKLLYRLLGFEDSFFGAALESRTDFWELKTVLRLHEELVRPRRLWLSLALAGATYEMSFSAGIIIRLLSEKKF